jgi:hypothetical protein
MLWCNSSLPLPLELEEIGVNGAMGWLIDGIIWAAEWERAGTKLMAALTFKN